jgi:hypothetical protein
MPSMAGRALEAALEDDVVHAVDIVLKGPGVARVTRLTEPGEVEAAITLLRRLAERQRAEGTGDGVVDDTAPAAAAGVPSPG